MRARHTLVLAVVAGAWACTERIELGGAELHATRSGVAHFTSQDDQSCLALIRRLSSYLPLNNAEDAPATECSDPADRMDARLDVYRALGIGEGESHVIRKAGGVVTDDEIRSLAISQRLLGTREIILIHHTDCGMLTFTDDEFKRSIQDEIGIKPSWSPESFPDVEEDVRQSLRRIEDSPFITQTESLRGFVFDVATGRLSEVKPD